jgi:hypothetical protein
MSEEGALRAEAVGFEVNGTAEAALVEDEFPVPQDAFEAEDICDQQDELWYSWGTRPKTHPVEPLRSPVRPFGDYFPGTP